MAVLDKEAAIKQPDRYEKEDFMDRIEKAKNARSSARKARDDLGSSDKEQSQRTAVVPTPKSFVR